MSKAIAKDNAEIAVAQMALYAVKQGIDPDCEEARAEYGKMRRPIEKHNKAFG